MVSMLRLEDFVLIKELGLGYDGKPMLADLCVLVFFFLMVFALFLRFRWFILDHRSVVEA